MLYFLFFTYFFITTSTTTIYNKNFFLKKKIYYNQMLELSKNELKTPIILNGNKTPLKKDLCHIICENSNMKFKEFTFDKFLYETPHLKYDNKLLYISDYLINNGRILNNYESTSLINIPKTTNLIVLEAENINSIPYKDINVNRRFETIEFPIIEKKEIVIYIHNLILHYNYNDDLLLLNWINYNIEVLNIEKINIVLFELNDMMNENNTIQEIHKCINFIIDGLIE